MGKKSDSSLKINSIELNYFASRREVIITAVSKDSSSPVKVLDTSFEKNDVDLMKPYNTKWYIGNTKDFPITRIKANSTTSLMAKLLTVHIDISDNRTSDGEPYKLKQYCMYFVSKTYAPVKRTDMLKGEEIAELLKALRERYKEVFSRDDRFSI